MKLAIRVDASTLIGSGHVMRCLALALALRDRGAEVLFISRSHEGNLLEHVRAQGFVTRSLPAPPHDTPESYGLLTVSQTTDAAETLASLADDSIDWLIVDHYGLGQQWEELLRPRVGQLGVLDDLADRPHSCDLLLDPTYPGDTRRYSGLVPNSATLLLGPRFTLIDRHFAQARSWSRQAQGPKESLFVFFGGSDLPNLTGQTLAALDSPALADLRAEIVIGSTNPHIDELGATVDKRPGTHLHGPREHLADLMAASTIAVGAGGVNVWERLCLGLPSVVVSLADNQVASCQALAEAGLLDYAGHIGEFDSAALAQRIEHLRSDADFRREAAIRGMAEVDGLGAARVAELLCPTPVSELELRSVTQADVGTAFMWANDAEVRRQSIHTQAIDWNEHVAWFSSKVDDPTCIMFILEAKGLPVAQARFDVMETGEGLLDYSVDPVFRGRGWAAILLRSSIEGLAARGITSVVADIRNGNIASFKALTGAGLVEETTSQANVGFTRLRRDGLNHG